ncbi:C39 family peptidase [bacterium]|nr:C39 family peptidase [bacterium]
MPSEAPGGQPVVLDVPYLAQSFLLCGGAAVAMVERWWGVRGVYAQDFAGLVRPSSGGILTTELVAATSARGWDTRVFRGTPEGVQRSLREGVPVVALIQVAADRYHYVVVLGWSDGSVVFHDPATAPYATLDERSFLDRWTGADRWALVVLPETSLAEAVVPETVPPEAVVPTVAGADGGTLPGEPTLPCPPWLNGALDAVTAGRLDDASGLLAEAGRACPDEPLILRETAGVRFKQGRDAEVIRLASEYLAIVPDDDFAWQLLATSRYRAGDRDGALLAWNRIGRPTVDLVRIDGVREIRFREFSKAISAPPGTPLTPSRLALARRRLSDIPALSRASVGYQPVPGGLVEVRASMVERPRVDRAWRLAAEGAIRAAAQNEVGIEIASPTGGGELWTASWRWAPARPRGVLRLEMPVGAAFPGILTIEGDWERFRFALDSARTIGSEETRRSAGVGFGGWVTPSLRPSAALRFERWSGSRRYLAASMSAEVRARNDRFVLGARTEYAVALTDQPSFTSGGTQAAWASSLGLNRTAWSARLGFDWVGGGAPLGSWPLAGGNLSWALPLRAHSLIDDGLIKGRSVGRTITSAGLAGDRPFYRNGPLIVAAGLFLDAARIAHAADGSTDAHFHLDGGGGLRLGLADGQLGVLRIDLARSLITDRYTLLTLGVHRNWPLFHQDFR